MRWIFLVASLMFVLGVRQSALADDSKAGAGGDASSDVCVGVSINGSPLDNLSCLNARLRQSALSARNRSDQSLSLETGAANAPSTAFNVFNETATHERLGDAFGHSPFPQRPEKTYSNPLVSGH